MSDPPIKFKRRKSRNTPGESHYLTFSTYHKKPYLSDERICKLLAKRINEAAIELNFAVLAYVFMPDHVHIMVHPHEEIYEMGDILKAMKQGPSKMAKSKKWISTKLWESGGGYDSNINNPFARQLAISYIHMNPVRKEIVEYPRDFRWSSSNWYHTEEPGDILCHHIQEFWC